MRVRAFWQGIREVAADVDWAAVVFFTTLIAGVLAVIVGYVLALTFGMLVPLDHTAGGLSVDVRKALAFGTPDALLLIALIVDGTGRLWRRVKARTS